MMLASQHEAAPVSPDTRCKSASVDFDASERLQLMQSGLPLCIFLESSEVVAIKPPAPLYIFVPRVSYLPTLIDKCHEHFKPYIQPSFGQPTSPFFDFGGIPIDWRLPIGIAFDILSSLKGGLSKGPGVSEMRNSPADTEISELAACGCDVQLPWCLTIHFHGSASSYLGGGATKVFSFQEFLGWASFESFFMNSLKQATYIINGSAVPFQRLPKAVEMQLLTASRTGAIAQFLDSCQQLLPTISPMHYKRIPVRLYVCGPPCFQLSLSFPCFKTNKACSPATTLDDGHSLRSSSERLDSASGVCRAGSASSATCSGTGPGWDASEGDAKALSTLGDLMHHVLPQLFPKLTRLKECAAQGLLNKTDECPEAVENDCIDTMPVNLEPGCEIGRRSCYVVVHGIQPLLQTPLFWLATTAPQLDMFLYIVVIVEEALMGAA
ncbi:autophagy protein 5 [Cyclospora cayetanensis]|uniref:Autophagy protein 5 n=2 Tax=Cyclospora cayetanensis TaxID=88456 RepID=A0A6P5WDJ5_9EIME|nr:autophagy protein 5 [Cyclospora cayetanensis]OEH77355.1 putative autophagy protein [Cyclospora cayetanensis]